jgi:uncharacterized integral membrane protein (TIGR00698 family)
MHVSETAASGSTSIKRMHVALRRLWPGAALSIAIALTAFLAEPLLAHAIRTTFGWSYALPAIVVALIIGVTLSGVATQPVFQPGMEWCVKKLLRIAIGLLGVRVALSDIADLGFGAALLVIGSMMITIFAGVLFARMLKLGDGFGVLAGAATAVCGASAALATATVVPHYPQKSADVAFAVVAANVVSTLVMVAYPPLCLLFGFDAQQTGLMLGATIHDMAQVVGAGYAVSERVGNTAVIVKLFRVLLLLPVVLVIGWWFMRRGAKHDVVKAPTPVFALAFMALCLVNSLAPLAPGLAPLYLPIKAALIQASSWGMLIAIAALGLGTTLASILSVGWRHIVVFAGATLVILGIALSGTLLIFPA